MDEINRQVFDAVDKTHTIRIVVDIPTKTLDAEDFLTSASNFINPFTTQWKAKHLTRLLVVDVYPRCAYIVLAINNHHYDYSIARKQHFLIPVYILCLSKRNEWRMPGSLRELQSRIGVMGRVRLLLLRVILIALCVCRLAWMGMRCPIYKIEPLSWNILTKCGTAPTSEPMC